MTDLIACLPVPSTYTRMLEQRLPQQVEALLQGSGLTAEQLLQAPTITVAQQLQVFRNARALSGRADWALDFGRQLNITSHGPLGFAALSAPTLGDGVDVLGKFARIRAPYLQFATRQIGQDFVLQIDSSAYPLADLELPLIEIVLQIANTYAEAVLGRQVASARLLIAQPAPAHAARYAEYFPYACQFAAPINALVLPASLRQMPCPLYDERTYQGSLSRCREALDNLLRPDDLRQRVEHWLSAHFEPLLAAGEVVSQPHLNDLAAALHLSPRTVIRRLAEQGSSFRLLREQQQQALACRLLGDVRYTVSDISQLLGYGDAANFGRSFRRITGMSPGQFRRRKD